MLAGFAGRNSAHASGSTVHIALATRQRPSTFTISNVSMPQWLVLPSIQNSYGAQTCAMPPRMCTVGDQYRSRCERGSLFFGSDQYVLGRASNSTPPSGFGRERPPRLTDGRAAARMAAAQPERSLQEPTTPGKPWHVATSSTPGFRYSQLKARCTHGETLGAYHVSCVAVP
jgi:hypothetical protein